MEGKKSRNEIESYWISLIVSWSLLKGSKECNGTRDRLYWISLWVGQVDYFWSILDFLVKVEMLAFHFFDRSLFTKKTLRQIKKENLKFKIASEV